MPMPIAPRLILSQNARTDLEALLRAHSTPQSLALRARIILRAADPDTPSNIQISREFNCSNYTVGKWRRRYHDYGLSGLQDAARSGRPQIVSTDTQPTIIPVGRPSPAPKAGIDQTKRARRKKSIKSDKLRPATKAIIEILHHKPNVYGINRSNWTQQSLADAYEKKYGQRMSKSTVCRLLKEAGQSWKKSKKVLTSPDPNYREKVELLLRTLQSLKVDEMLFFIDELGPLQVKRYGGRCYTPKSETPTHPQNPHSKGSITLYGALSATTNQVTWFYGDTKDTTAMIDLVEVLFNQYHDRSKIYITWDAASWHRSNELVEWIDSLNTRNKDHGPAPIIELVPLPSSAQFLDVIEAVFSGMKRAVIHNSDYQSEEDMKGAISRHFKERNEFFRHNPKRAGKKIWEIDFFEDYNNIRSGNYREW